MVRTVLRVCGVVFDQLVPVQVVLKHKPSIWSARPRSCWHIRRCSRRSHRASVLLISAVC